MFSVRNAPIIRAGYLISIGQKGSCMQSNCHQLLWRGAHTYRQTTIKTDQQERAIRIKRMNKRAKPSTSPLTGSSKLFEKKVIEDRQDKGKPIRRVKESLRDRKYKASQRLMGLFREDLDPREACQRALALVDRMRASERRTPYVQNPVLRHLIRAGKGTHALAYVQNMKKDGISPTIETFQALFTGATKLNLDRNRDVNIVRKFLQTFDRFLEFWNNAIKHEQRLVIEDKPNSSSLKGKFELPKTTGESYRAREIQAWEDAIGEVDKVCRTVDHFLEFLLHHGFHEKAAKIYLSSVEVARPPWSKSKKSYAPGLVRILAKRIVTYDHEHSGDWKSEDMWQEAVKHANVAIGNVNKNDALPVPNLEQEKRRKAILQQSTRDSLGLTVEDRRQLFDDKGVHDGPPKSLSRV